MKCTSRRVAAMLLLIAAALAGCARAPAPPPPPAASAAVSAPANGWARFRDEFLETYFKAEPALAVYVGRHEFDGALPDRSAVAMAHEIADLHAGRARALAFKDSDLER